MAKVQCCSVENPMRAAQWCNTLDKSWIFLEGNVHSVRGSGSIYPRSHENKHQSRKSKWKNKGKCLHSCSGMSVWSTNCSQGKQKSVWGTRDSGTNLKSCKAQRTLECINSVLRWCKKNPDKTSHPSQILSIIISQWGIYQGKGETQQNQAFCQGVKWNGALQLQAQELQPYPSNIQGTNIIAIVLQNSRGEMWLTSKFALCVNK